MNTSTLPQIIMRNLFGSALALLVLPWLVACDTEWSPTGPKSPALPMAAAPGVPAFVPAGFPPITGPGRIYTFSEITPPRACEYDPSVRERASRYVLYDDGRFALQDELPFELLGSYVETDGSVQLHWDANSTIPPEYPFPPEWWPGPWEGTATIVGETFTVRYNLLMSLDCFQDAVYVRTP